MSPSLVTDLNNALAAAGLGGAVVAGQTGGVITLTELERGTLQVSAATSDPATTELKLPSVGGGTEFRGQCVPRRRWHS